MNTTINVNFVRFFGFFADATQEQKTVQLSYQVEEIVFFTWDEGNLKIVDSFIPDARKERYSFQLDQTTLSKFPTHRTINPIERNRSKKELFFFVSSTSKLYINAEAVEIKGPFYTKKVHTLAKHNQIPTSGAINYSLIKTTFWNGGSFETPCHYDHLEFLEVQSTMEKALQELRYNSSSVMEGVDEAIKILLKFKEDSEAILSFWKEASIPELQARYARWCNKKYNKEEKV